MKSQERKADIKDEGVPYEFPHPDNAGILFNFESISSTLIYLDFEDERIYLLDISDKEVSPENYGFPVNFTLNATYDTVKTAVDIAGGIDLDEGGSTLRYTGVQVVELLSTTVDTSKLRREIFSAIFNQFSKHGILKEDLIEIFGSSSSGLSVPDYYHWADYLKIMSGRISYVN